MDARTLRPYQELMIDHIIATPKCALYSFMGSGKTAATLYAIDRLTLAGVLTKPTLVVAPLRVARDVWPEEVKEWPDLAGMQIVPILGTDAERRAALYKKADVYTVNFENLEWLIDLWKEHWPYGMIVIDESTKLKSLRASIRTNKDGTTYVTGQGGKRAKSLLKCVYHNRNDRFVELSGTPSPNGIENLWGQLFFVDYGKRLGRVFNAFQSRWLQRSFDGFGYEPLPHAQGEIQAAIKDVCLSLRSKDWFALEEPIVRHITVELPPAVRKQYRELERALYTEVQNHPIEAFNAGAKTAKLRQFCAGAVYLGTAEDAGPRKWVPTHDEKIKVLEEIVEEAAGAPILVAYHFKSDLERLKAHFPKGRELDQKTQTIKDFNAGRIPILFCHPASAGHGLNLQNGSNILVYFSCDFNAETHWQVAERIGPVRQAQAGLQRNVYHYYITVKNSVDEDILENLEGKRAVQDVVMEGLRRRLTNT